jgi:hypothetical protein
MPCTVTGCHGLSSVVLWVYTALLQTVTDIVLSESEHKTANRVIERVDEIPFPDELFANVGIWKIRFLKRRLFAARLYSGLVHLSLCSMSDVFTSRSEALRYYALGRLAEQWKLDYLRQLEDLLPAHFFPGQSPLTHVAMWVLKTKKISPAVLYLASALDKIYETFHSEDTACLRSDIDRPNLPG